MSTVTLYHYTCLEHVATILEAGHLRTTESNVSGKREHAGPPVVWLTTADTPDLGLGLDHPLGVDKKRIRFTVELHRRSVHKWRQWAAAQGSDPAWVARLARAGGASTWRVTERPVLREQWREVRDLRTGELIAY